MKQIRLVPALELGNKLNVDVMDYPGQDERDGAAFDPAEAKERKRCGITLEYSPRDIRELRDRGIDRKAMKEYYRSRVYDLVKVNISQDWECAGGMEEILEIVMKYTDRYLQG